jgi:hypothetical protein
MGEPIGVGVGFGFGVAVGIGTGVGVGVGVIPGADTKLALVTPPHPTANRDIAIRGTTGRNLIFMGPTTQKTYCIDRDAQSCRKAVCLSRRLLSLSENVRSQPDS